MITPAPARSLLRPPPGAPGRPLQAAALAAVLLAALAGCSEKPVEASAPAAQPPALVGVEPARRMSGEGSVVASGLTGYLRETVLSFGAPGQIEMLAADEGDVVAAGARVATLRRTTVGADAEEAEVARRTAEQQLARVQSLFDKGFASQAALDNARLAVQRSREGASIIAPSSGVVLRRHVEPAQMVAAGQAVLTLGEARFGMVVRAPVVAADAAQLKVGAPAEVRFDARPARKGEIVRIAAKSADATGAFEVEVRIAETDGLRSGEVAEVILATESGASGPPRFLVPAIALTDARADQGQIFIVDESGVARRRAVETGGLTAEGVIILKGLAEGEQVVTSGATTVRDGEPVAIAPAG